MKDLMKRRRLTYDVGDGVEASRPPAHARAGGPAARRVSPTLSAAVIAEARNALEAAHASGDYRYQCVGDLIRAAFVAYGDGLRLAQPARAGRRKRHTVKLSAQLVAAYERLPSQSRGLIIERALASFLAAGLDDGRG